MCFKTVFKILNTNLRESVKIVGYKMNVQKSTDNTYVCKQQQMI